ncbi:MAG: tRNA epoxyqueuosine(34) reductase QueG [Alphaproteobacteria bacterium]
MSATLLEAIRGKAAELGFTALGVSAARLEASAARNLADFVARGYHGDMAWLAGTLARRGDPRALWPEARSAILLAISYAPDGDPLALIRRPAHGNVSVYARGRDYHDVIKTRLRVLARWLGERESCGVKLFVDTAPLMEKPLAAAAGLGWQGKHTNLVSRRHGSWLFLASLLVTLELPSDAPERDHCGSCRRCLDSCPTKAFPAPYRLDARRCISYLTIEHKGHIAREFRRAIGNRIYGCDDCLAVCPWNKFAARTEEYAFLPRSALVAPRLADLVQLDDGSFRRLFAGSPIKRIGRARFVRNVLIAIGNSGEPALAAVVEPLLEDPSPLVRAMAVWALGRLLARARFARLRAGHRAREADAAVRAEWDGGEGDGGRGNDGLRPPAAERAASA